MTRQSVNKRQKYKRGDLVRVASDLGPAKRHFTSDCDAVIIGSYRNLHGGDNIDSYAVVLLPMDGPSWCAWYDETELTLKVKRFFQRLETEMGQ